MIFHGLENKKSIRTLIAQQVKIGRAIIIYTVNIRLNEDSNVLIQDKKLLLPELSRKFRKFLEYF
jgi:hypothetical protein